ncbi:hypothetical protein ACQZV8_18875 [Magnetococcales bacterium HHB-1]
MEENRVRLKKLRPFFFVAMALAFLAFGAQMLFTISVLDHSGRTSELVDWPGHRELATEIRLALQKHLNRRQPEWAPICDYRAIKAQIRYKVVPQYPLKSGETSRNIRLYSLVRCHQFRSVESGWQQVEDSFSGPAVIVFNEHQKEIRINGVSMARRDEGFQKGLVRLFPLPVTRIVRSHPDQLQIEKDFSRSWASQLCQGSEKKRCIIQFQAG